MIDTGHYLESIRSLQTLGQRLRAREDRLVETLAGLRRGELREFALAWGVRRRTANARLRELRACGRAKWFKAKNEWRAYGGQ